MKKKSTSVLELIFILFVFFNIGTIFSYIFINIGFDITNFNGLDMAYFDLLMKLILGILVFILYGPTLIRDYHEFKKDLKANINKCTRLFALLLGLKVVAAIVSTVLATMLGFNNLESANQSVINSLTGSAPLIMLISSVFLAPFIEEGIFRLGFRKVFKNKYLFIALSGIIFGGMHIFPTDLLFKVALVQSLIYVVMGIMLAYIYEKERNIWLVIVVHALNNLLGIIALLI